MGVGVSREAGYLRVGIDHGEGNRLMRLSADEGERRWKGEAIKMRKD
jgi:hypothetical protein